MFGLFNKKLSVKLVVSFLALGFLTVCSLSWLSIYQSNQSLKNLAAQELKINAKSTADSLQNWIDGLDTGLATLEELMKAGGVQAFNDKNLTAFRSGNPDFELVFIADKDGNIFASSEGKRFSVADREYFKTAINGQTVVSDPLISRDSGKPVIVVARPFDDGNWKGVLAGVVSLQALDNIVSKIKIGETGYAYVIDNKGTLLAHPKKEKIGKESLLNSSSKELVKLVQDKMVKLETGFGHYDYEGISKYVAFAPLKEARWAIGVTAPEKEFTAPISSLTKQLILVSVIILLMLAALTIGIARKITQPIRVLSQQAQLISHGDLTAAVEVSSQDEIGQLAGAFASMVEKLKEVVMHIKESVKTVHEAAVTLNAGAQQSTMAIQEITESNQEVASGAEIQNNKIDTTTHTLRELSDGIQQIAASNSNTAMSTMDANQEASLGNEVLQNAIGQLERVKEILHESGEKAVTLRQHTEEISQITNLISGIANQTNLLALNAAIEAARAGEEGRGFAVVAEEVRKLAEETGGAIKKIENIIKRVTADTNDTVEIVSQGSAQFEKGNEMVLRAGEAFAKIQHLIAKVNEESQDVSASSQEISAGTHEIVSAFEEINRISQQFNSAASHVTAATEEQTANMEEFMANAEELEAIADELNNMITYFKI